VLVVIVLTGARVVRSSMDHVLAAAAPPAPGATPDLGSSAWEPGGAAASTIPRPAATAVLAIFEPAGWLRGRARLPA
jgi:hypothetical protein